MIADHVAGVTGHPLTFVFSCLVIALWTLASVFFRLSNGWQSLVNTVTTVVTFLMVFLIQSTQNRGGAAVQAKLDELIRALEPANNLFIGIEDRTINEVHELRQETVNEVKKLEELVVQTAREHDRPACAPNYGVSLSADASQTLCVDSGPAALSGIPVR